MPRVRPGVFEVRASALRAASLISSVDFPTFERPAMATSGGPTGGNEASARVSATKTAVWTRGATAEGRFGGGGGRRRGGGGAGRPGAPGRAGRGRRRGGGGRGTGPD